MFNTPYGETLCISILLELKLQTQGSLFRFNQQSLEQHLEYSKYFFNKYLST